MIKKITRVYIWIIMSFVLQFSILFFLNSYLIREKSVKIENYDTLESQDNYDYKMPSIAKKIMVSTSKRFAVFSDDGFLKIKNLTKEDDIHSVEKKNKEKVLLYKWIHDRDILVYVLSEENEYNMDFKLKTYDVESKVVREFPVIEGLEKNSMVDQIELSTVTNIVYLKIISGDESGLLYKYNIMNEKFFSMYISKSNKVCEFNFCDKILYEKNNNIYLKNGLSGKYRSVDFEGRGKIIGIDKNDNAYIAIIDENLSTDNDLVINKIIVSDLVDKSAEDNTLKFNDFKEIILKRDVNYKDINITDDGNIYSVNLGKKEIYNVKSNKTIAYEGSFISINDFRVNLLNKKYNLEFIDVAKIGN